MSGGNRLRYVTLGGCLAAFLWANASLAQEPQDVAPTTLKGQPVPEGGQNTSKGGATDQGHEKEPTPEKLSPSLDKIEAAIRDLIAQERAAQGQGPKDEEIRDLKAQEGMALWAKAMFWATVAAVILTFAGIVLIWRTLIHTRHAAEAARDMVTEGVKTTSAAIEATNAAIEANRIAREMSERQLRAYILPTKRHVLRQKVNPHHVVRQKIQGPLEVVLHCRRILLYRVYQIHIFFLVILCLGSQAGGGETTIHRDAFPGQITARI